MAKRLGEMAELAFMQKAISMGFGVAKPWGDSDRYDFILNFGRVFWRVQVKSAWKRRVSYWMNGSGFNQMAYTSEDIDFLVAYINPEETWYVFPVEALEARSRFCLSPRASWTQYNKYREAWGLLRGEPLPEEPVRLRAPKADSEQATEPEC